MLFVLLRFAIQLFFRPTISKTCPFPTTQSSLSIAFSLPPLGDHTTSLSFAQYCHIETHKKITLKSLLNPSYNLLSQFHHLITFSLNQRARIFLFFFYIMLFPSAFQLFLQPVTSQHLWILASHNVPFKLSRRNFTQRTFLVGFPTFYNRHHYNVTFVDSLIN